MTTNDKQRAAFEAWWDGLPHSMKSLLIYEVTKQAYELGRAALQSQDREDAVEVMAILDTGEWSLVRSAPCEWLTDEANNEHRWCVQRQLPPFCGKDGVRHWTGPTAISALRAGMKAIDHARRVEGE